jgi:hypothetical protein
MKIRRYMIWIVWWLNKSFKFQFLGGRMREGIVVHERNTL